MNYKKYLFLFLYIPLCVYPSLPSQHSLVEQSLLQHIYELKRADSYWAHVKQTPVRHFFSNLSNLGFKDIRIWNKKIEEKRASLHEEINKTVQLLGHLVCTTQNGNPDIYIESLEINPIISAEYSIPSHIQRCWPVYLGAFASTAALYYLTTNLNSQDFQERKTELYATYINKPYEDIKNLKNTLNSLKRKCQDDDAMYRKDLANFLNELQDDPLFKETADFKKLQKIAYSNLPLSSAHDEINRMASHIEKQILKLISSASEIQPPSEVSENLKKTHQAIDQAIESATKEFSEKNPPASAQIGIPFLASIFGGKEQLKKLANNTVDGVAYFSNLTKNCNSILERENPHFMPYLKILSRCYLFKFHYYELGALNGVRNFTLFMGALACYGSYRGIKKIHASYYENNIYKPLRRILMELQFHLNRYHNTTQENLPAVYYGWTAYWIDQLKKLQPSVPENYQSTFTHAIHELENNSYSPKQKNNVISYLCQELDFLH